MRPIIFRGKRADKEEWVYGQLTIGLEHCLKTKKKSNVYYIARSDMSLTRVTNVTVGQFTGLTALDGMPIYEGDIVSVKPFDKMEIGVVVYEYGCFLIEGVSGNDLLCNYDVITVLGNIHDNPELIQKGDKEW